MDPASFAPALRKMLLSTRPRDWAVLGSAGYLLLVALLRNRRLRQMKKQHNYPTRESFSRMTDDEAWKILITTAQMEFPFMFTKALQFALFRTYGIPTISKLLVRTSEFSVKRTAMKRYSDTSLIVAEFMLHPPSSSRTLEGIARMNYLHHGYRASGNILDNDMLYTLSLFALEPVRWINRYEWRELSDLEVCATGTFWKSVGDAMQVSYERLPSYKTGFRDGLHWFREIEAWSIAYEAEHMVPDINNKKTADETVNVLLWDVPEVFHPLGRQAVSYLMDDRLRTAMMYENEKPGWLLSNVLATILSLRKYTLRYLSLPRPRFLRFSRVTEDGEEPGPHFILEYEGAPYYVKPTVWNRWGPMAWITWIRGCPLPGDDGSTYFPNGYDIKDIGPKTFEGKGRKFIEETQQRLRAERTGGCPFAVSR